MFIDKEQTSSLSIYSPLLLFLIYFLYVLFNKRYIVRSSIFQHILYFEFSVVLVAFFHSIYAPLPTFLLYFSILLPIISLLSLELLTSSINREIIVYGFAIVYLFLFWYYISNSQYIYSIDDMEVTNASYTLLYLLPLLLCSKNTLLKVLAIVLTCVAVFLSLKRGSILSLILGLLIYIICLLLTKTGSRKKFITFIVIVIGIFAFVQFAEYFNNQSNNIILERFDSIDDDRGSGRLDILEHTVDMISSSNFFEILFGHGWNHVIIDSDLGFSAHNDFLEILYDFGVIVFVLYLLLYVKLFRFVHKLQKSKSKFTAPMAMSLTIFIMASMVSHIVIYPYYMLTFLITWSFIIVSDKNNISNI